MPATHALIELAGEVALLLFGLHLARGGILRAFGSNLRHVLARALRHRLAAVAAGTAVTVALQSSTATAFMLTTLAAGGAIALVPALAVMLGANVGTALVSVALSFDTSLVWPVLVAAGLALFRSAGSARLRHAGRAVMGLGLLLLALELIVATIAPAASGAAVRPLLQALIAEPLPVLLATALLAMAMHASVAAVLIVVTLAQAGLVTAPAALAMVLGANLGSALNPLLAARGGGPAALRLPLGNLATRLAGSLAVLAFLDPLAARGEAAIGLPGFVLLSHLAFNAALALLFLPLLRPLASLLERILPEHTDTADPARPRYLDPASLATPPVALADATREILRLADLVEAMLQGSRRLLREDDAGLATELRRSDDVIDRLHAAVRAHLVALAARDLDGTERDRVDDACNAALNLEHAGDILDKGVLALTARRIRRRVRLGPAQLAEAETMHDHLLRQLRLAMAVLVGGDTDAALALVDAKERFREIARTATAGQFARLREEPGAVETAALHVDLVRDLKRVEAHLAAIAHPLLERRGLLRPSRLLVPAGP